MFASICVVAVARGRTYAFGQSPDDSCGGGGGRGGSARGGAGGAGVDGVGVGGGAGALG